MNGYMYSFIRNTKWEKAHTVVVEDWRGEVVGPVLVP